MDVPFTVDATVKYIDFEGVSDGKSLKTIIQAMQPRSIVFVRGEADALEEMKRFGTEDLKIARVLTPDKGQTVDASSDESVYSGWLNEGLRGQLEWQLVDEMEVAWLASVVVTDQDLQDPLDRRLLGPVPIDQVIGSLNFAVLLIYSLPKDDETEDGRGSTHRTLFVGQAALKDVKAALDRRGFRCEFDAGLLIVNENVTVRKDPASAQLRVDGAFCSDYFVVRDICYSEFKRIN